MLALAWSLATVIFFAFAFWSVPQIEPLLLKGSQLGSQTGKLEGDRRIAVEGKKGYLAYGPYNRVVRGQPYTAVLTYESRGKKVANYQLSLDYGKTLLLKSALPPSRENSGTFSTRFEIPSSDPEPHIFTFDVEYRGRGALSVSQLELYPILDESPPALK